MAWFKKKDSVSERGLSQEELEKGIIESVPLLFFDAAGSVSNNLSTEKEILEIYMTTSANLGRALNTAQNYSKTKPSLSEHLLTESANHFITLAEEHDVPNEDMLTLEQIFDQKDNLTTTDLKVPLYCTKGTETFLNPAIKAAMIESDSDFIYRQNKIPVLLQPSVTREVVTMAFREAVRHHDPCYLHSAGVESMCRALLSPLHFNRPYPPFKTHRASTRLAQASDEMLNVLRVQEQAVEDENVKQSSIVATAGALLGEELHEASY